MMELWWICGGISFQYIVYIRMLSMSIRSISLAILGEHLNHSYLFILTHTHVCQT